MRNMRSGILAAAILAAMPAQAGAATLIISLTGTILNETAPGMEPAPIQVGDQLNLRAEIDISLVEPYDSIGTTLASFYHHGYFGILHNVYSWRSIDEIHDGFPGGDVIAPALLFRDKKVVGIIGHLVPLTFASNLRSFGSDPKFTLGNEQGLYGNDYLGPAFEGQWNFATSSAAVPEPATWAMLMLGFAALGALVRKRRSGQAVSASA